MFTQARKHIDDEQAQVAAASLFGDADDKKRRLKDKEASQERHRTLIMSLEDERDLQMEERLQAAIDEDMYDHRHWRRDDASVLTRRGQAPLVYPYSRQTIDWLAGMEKRMRKDWKILPREENDETGAELKTQVMKYTDDVNKTQWHRSRAFKQAAISGLSWLEEGLNPQAHAGPGSGTEIIWSGQVDWRDVYRDSRARHFALDDARYNFRRVVTDLDYGIALLPKAEEHLRAIAGKDHTGNGQDDLWYLGERLTGASDLGDDEPPFRMRDRQSFVSGGDRPDRGRRQQVELLECWYRVMQRVEMFEAGPLRGKMFNAAENGHQQLKRDGHAMYGTVRSQMRVMVCTKDQPLWDGVSPYRHGKFTLIPLWAYRRYSDGMAYGVMRGMRDLQDAINKRASKTMLLLNSNRIKMTKNAVDDVETLRHEAARPDGIIEYKFGAKLDFEPHTNEIIGQLNQMDRDIVALRDVGGVTNENLGRGPNSQSGIAIERKQDQGSLTTSELFDNNLLSLNLQGQIRLSNIEQFKSDAEIMRITGDKGQTEFIRVNEIDADGNVLNDLTAREADFVVATQDYRESYMREAMVNVTEMLGRVGTFAPEFVAALLDLVLDASEIPNKDEWVSRIRKLNGQRDPSKPITPEEQAAEQANNQQQKMQQDMAMEEMRLKLAEVTAKIGSIDADKMVKTMDALMLAIQAASQAQMAPELMPVADAIAKSAGYKDPAGQAGQAPNLPQPPAMPQDQLPPTPTAPEQSPIQPEAPQQAPIQPELPQ